MQEQRHPVFNIFTREYLHKVTGYSKNYLSRVATGNLPLTRTFVDQCCYKLKRTEEELFLPDTVISQSAQEQ